MTPGFSIATTHRLYIRSSGWISIAVDKFQMQMLFANIQSRMGSDRKAFWQQKPFRIRIATELSKLFLKYFKRALNKMFEMLQIPNKSKYIPFEIHANAELVHLRLNSRQISPLKLKSIYTNNAMDLTTWRD